MKRFHVLRHPDGTLTAIKEGFSWPGFLLGGFWLLYHRVYVLGGGAVLGGIVLYGIFPSPEGYFLGVPYGHRFGIADAGNIIIQGLIGMLGNAWRLDSVIKRGFELIDSVEANTSDGARAVHLRGGVNHNGAILMERREPTA